MTVKFLFKPSRVVQLLIFTVFNVSEPVFKLIVVLSRALSTPSGSVNKWASTTTDTLSTFISALLIIW